MASSSARPERVYHQDYIARVRYSNALPPPPNPPKLLDIPNTGLSGGQYTSAAYASRLAREQPLNIEADAELGMPIDLVGLPGVFDGDETAIHALERPPAPHPQDRPLLRPLATLGKSANAAQGVSFLRRTEYITSAGTARQDHPKELMRPRPVKRRRGGEAPNDDPIHILRSIIKGFDLAYPNEAYTGQDSTENLRGAEIPPEEKTAWKFPRHPTNPDLKLLDSYPVVPDMEAFADQIGHSVVKFSTAPVSKTAKYDARLDLGIFRPLIDSNMQQDYEARRALDASTAPPMFDIEYFLPREESVQGLKRRFDPEDPEHNDDSLYDADTQQTDAPHFQFSKLRTYETTSQILTVGPYSEYVAMALHDSAPGSQKSKGAYLYPIGARTILRPRRKVQQAGPSQGDDGMEVDILQVAVTDPDEAKQSTKERLIQEVYSASTEV